ncbi:hypothetical protein HU200_058765 [Digitaria exilis]|uniref:Dehydrin n=1 Tax=Digitaria exilis TaxID=1010633 RepID=A0A835ADG3_9POAL|nr:hypothetical protein HU200_058765 [Digitaria exilis]
MAQQHGHATTGVDAYGNPVAVQGHGQAVAGVPAAGTGAPQFQPAAAVEQKPRGILHRSSSSSSSSSSEDDGMGGRRKKGIKQKIKEKLPGGKKTNQPQPQAGTTGTYGQAGHAGVTGPVGTHGGATGEKKGIMDKIKEKLPGHH